MLFSSVRSEKWRWVRENAAWCVPFSLAFGAQFLSTLVDALFLVLPDFLLSRGATAAQIGLVAGAASVGALAVRPVAGYATDRYGRRAVFLFGAVLHLVGTALFLAVVDIGPLLIAGRMLQFFGQAAVAGALLTLISDLLPLQHRSRGFAIFMMTGMSALGIGPVLAQSLLWIGGYEALFIAAAAISLASFAVGLGIAETKSSSRASADPLSTPSVFDPPLLSLWVVVAAFSLAFAVMFVFLDAFSLNVVTHSFAPFFAVYAISPAVVRLFFGNLPETVGHVRLLVVSMLLFASGLLLLALAPTIVFVLMAACIIGISNGYITPVFGVLVTERASIRKRGTAFAMLSAILDAGPLLSAPILGGVADHMGYRMMFVFSALIPVCGAGLFLIMEIKLGRKAKHPCP